MLELRDVHLSYGSIKAVDGVSLNVAAEEIVTVVGSNGAGKSSLVKAVLGLERIETGHVYFDGKDISETSTSSRVSSGIALVPEGRELFGLMSVTENLLVGAWSLADKPRRKENLEFVFDLFPALAKKRNIHAARMSGGEQQMLAFGRALMSSPRCLLLDEPTIGLAPMIEDQLMDAIQHVARETGAAVLLVEQNAMLALENSERAYVMELGKIGKSGLSSELLNNPDIAVAYLGGS